MKNTNSFVRAIITHLDEHNFQLRKMTFLEAGYTVNKMDYAEILVEYVEGYEGKEVEASYKIRKSGRKVEIVRIIIQNQEAAN